MSGYVIREINMSSTIFNFYSMNGIYYCGRIYCLRQPQRIIQGSNNSATRALTPSEHWYVT